MNQKLAAIIFAFAIIVAVVAGFFSPERHAPPPAAGLIREKLKGKEGLKKAPEPSPSATHSKSSGKAPSRRVLRRSLAGDQNRAVVSERFLRKYGQGLRLIRAGDRVVRVDGTSVKRTELSVGNKAAGFSPARENDLSTRAQEILDDSRSLLGFGEGIAFKEPLLAPGRSTGTVYFQQEIDGVSVYPGGVVTISIGPEGELRRLDSSAFVEARIENQIVLDQPPESRLVLYVTQTEPEAILRYSYVTQDRGVETVRDAETGSVLFERDRRVYR